MTTNQKKPTVGQQTNQLNDQQGKVVNMKHNNILFLLRDMIKTMKQMDIRIQELENSKEVIPKTITQGNIVDFKP